MELVSPEEAAAELNVTTTTIYRYCRAGRLGRKWGRVWLITRDELGQFQATRRKPGRPPKKP